MFFVCHLASPTTFSLKKQAPSSNTWWHVLEFPTWEAIPRSQEILDLLGVICAAIYFSRSCFGNHRNGVIHFPQKIEWDLTKRPRSVSCDGPIRYSGFLRGPWNGTVLWVRLLGLFLSCKMKTVFRFFHWSWNRWIMLDHKSLRIQVCPKKGITPTFLFFSDGIGTREILFDRRGLDS